MDYKAQQKVIHDFVEQFPLLEDKSFFLRTLVRAPQSPRDCAVLGNLGDSTPRSGLGVGSCPQ